MPAISKVFNDESLLDSLPSKEVAELSLGDGVGIVYDPVSGDNAQVVRGIVIGGVGSDLFVLEPRHEAPSTTWGRRAFRVGSGLDDVKRMTCYDFTRQDADFGHRPTQRESLDWPHDSSLGEVLKIVPMDVDVGREGGQGLAPFRLPMYLHATPSSAVSRAGWPYERRTSVCSALCHRLFEAEGGAECDYEFGIPTDRRDPRVRMTDGESWWNIQYALAWVLDDERFDPLEADL